MPHSRHDRRQFISATSAALAAIAGAPELAAAQAAAAAQTVGTGGGSPDLIVINAKVYTMDARTPRAEAFAVSAGRFTAVGSTSDIKGLAGKNTQTFDAKGMTVVPGFIDCHNHAGGEVLLNEVLVGNPFEVEFVSIRSIIGKLRDRAQATPAGTWVEGFFFDDTKLSDKRALNVHDLDEVSTEHPVIVRHRGGHTYFYNSKAFAMAGITKDTPNPMGGTYDKDESGQLTGRVTDLASAPFSKVGDAAHLHAGRSRSSAPATGVAHISKQFARYGLTTVHHEGGNLPAMQDVRAARRPAASHQLRGQRPRARGDDLAPASRAASATTGSSSAPPPSTPSTARSRSGRWR